MAHGSVRPFALALAAWLGVGLIACGPKPTSPSAPSGSIRLQLSSPTQGAPAVSTSPSPLVSPALATCTPPSASAGGPIDVRSLAGRLVFSYDTGLWLSDANGSHRRQLTSDGGFDPTWSPNGRHIVYRRLLATDDGEIWIVDPDGQHRHDLVNDPHFSDWGPAWSPDGRKLAFDSNRIVGLALWLMNGDGTSQHILTHGHGEYPSWSPDGQKLAYAGGSYYDIRIVSSDGSDDHAVTTTAAYDMGPAWSPDGRWIAYHTQADYYPDVTEPGQGPEMEIHLVRPDGSGDHRITCDRIEDGFPAWSPDGRYLMWSRMGELVVARPDGSGMVEVGAGNFPAWIP